MRKPVVAWSMLLTSLALGGSFPVNALGDAPAPPASKWPVALGPSRDPVGPFATVRLPRTSFKGEKPRGAALALPARRAVVFYQDDQVGRAKKTRVMLCDVGHGKILIDGTMEGAFLPLDLDPEGIRVLVRADSFGIGKKDQAGIWTMAAEGPPKVQQWAPYANEAQGDRDILWGAFVGAGRVATLSTGGRLAVWDAATLKRLAAVEASPAVPAVSPNGNYVAFLRDSQAGLLDVSTGEVVGFLPLADDLKSAALAFRPDGQMLLCAAQHRVVLLDVQSGRVKTTVIPGVTGKGLNPVLPIGWADDRLLYVNYYLLDPDVPVPIWHYMGGEWSRPAGGYVWFLAKKGFEENALVPVRLPHPGAVKKMMEARADSGSFLLKPGDAVRVDVSRVPKEYQADARQALEKALRKTNYQPAATASLVLDVVPSPRQGFQERTYTYYKMGPFGIPSGEENRKEKHRFPILYGDVHLLKDGKEIWIHLAELTPGPPLSITLKQGESAADKLAPYMLPDYKSLERLELPKFLQEQLGRGVTRMSLGSCTVTPDGIDDKLSAVRERLEKVQKTPPKAKR